MAATAAGEVGVISHVHEHSFHVGKSERLLARSLVFSEGMKLSQCNLIPLVPVFLSEVRLHVLKEGVGGSGREIAGLADHVLSSSTKPGCISGGVSSSLALQSGQGIPGAPQPQA
jgi:hypothetical protein